ISAFHFHRVFRALTGETMFAFLQRRRLLRAIEMIHEARFSLTDIALECGFDSGSSLSRAFRKQLGCTPTQYRQRHPPLLLPPARVRAQDKLALPVDIRETKTRQAIVVERRGMIEHSFEQAAAAAFRVLTRELKRVNGWPFVHERIGMCPDEASLVPDAEARYQGGFFCDDALPAPVEEAQRITIPAGLWVVSLHCGSYASLWQPWNRMYRNWLPTSGYQLRATSPFEIYLNHPGQTPPERLQTEIWIPIE
ncbi:MAG: GyrI-like domain-containing protein, partial [Blastocatellia bacterium]